MSSISNNNNVQHLQKYKSQLIDHLHIIIGPPHSATDANYRITPDIPYKNMQTDYLSSTRIVTHSRSNWHTCARTKHICNRRRPILAVRLARITRIGTIFPQDVDIVALRRIQVSSLIVRAVLSVRCTRLPRQRQRHHHTTTLGGPRICTSY